MASSLSNLPNNLSEEIHRINCKDRRDDKNVRLVELHIYIATVFLNIQTLKLIYQNTNVCVLTKIINTSLT